MKLMEQIMSSKNEKPDDSKISEIWNIPTPQDKKGLKCFIDMTKYLAQYITRETSNVKNPI